MKIVFAIILLFAHAICKPQLSLKGSFMIIAKGTDGIIIASDSRGSFYDNSAAAKKPLAYHDSVQKCFIIRKTAMAITGDGLYGQMFFNGIIDNFTLIHKNSLLKPSNTLEVFMKYCKMVMPEILYNQISTNTMATVGYEGDKAILCYYLPNNGKIICTDKFDYIESARSEFYDLYKASMSCKDLGLIAQNSILKYAINENKKYDIGGPIRIIFMNKKEVKWMNYKPAFNWKTAQEFIKDYRKGKVSIQFLSAQNKSRLEKMFTESSRP